ncbi:MAG TPA: hypothetical protein VGN72_08135 [Tepidisphaeraceae bacterium]|jgi:hypothetical protein|nr:hypothetical protein [Tepidisphaeraceae bacterium]
MRMRNLIIGLTFTGALAILGSSTTHAAPLDPQQVPKDPKWVIHFDADQTKTSTVGSAIIDEVLARPDTQQGLDMLLRLAGFSFPNDLHGVTLYGDAFGEEHNVVLVHGTFDSNRVLGVLELAPSYTNEIYGDREVVSWEDKGKTMYGSFLRNDLIAIARSADLVKRAADVLDKKAETMAPLAGAVPAKDAGVLMYVEGRGLAELAKTQQASPAMANVESAWITMGENADKQLFAKGHVEAPDAQRAQRLLRAAEGIRAIVSMKAAEADADDRLQMADELLTKLKLSQTEQGVDLSFETPAEKVVEAIKSQVLRRPAAVK